MPIQIRPDGPIPARVMIVGEAPGADEEREGIPFVGASGQELNRMLHEAGINRSECFVTNVCRIRPLNNDISTLIAAAKKDRTIDHQSYRGKYVKRPILEGIKLLQTEIETVRPNIIIALGNTSLWALTGIWGITKWRGSMLYSDLTTERFKCIPTIHPAAVLRQWDQRQIAVQDLRRAATYRDGRAYPIPKWKFTLRPSLENTLGILQELTRRLDGAVLRISFDLETRNGHIACAGLSWDKTEGLCIPFMCVENKEGYWTEEQEVLVVYKLSQVLQHRNVEVVGQNLLYDAQYTYRHWNFVPRVVQDSMLSQHVAFAGLRKSLDFQASMYCQYYRYWKDDGKNWEPGVGEDQLWSYNLEDCVRTDEVAAVLASTINRLGLREPHEFQQSMFWPVLRAMILGVRIDQEAREKMRVELTSELEKRQEYFKTVLGHPLNPRSPKQMMALFYTDLQQPVQMKRGKKGVPSRPTLDDEALTKLGNREPLLRPLLKWIAEFRSIGVFLGNFVEAELDTDSRMRCSYNICGTETYRLSSSENAFGSGTNLQNIPKGNPATDPDDLVLPNIRKLFVPDPGFTFFDMDLDRADLQVVVWEVDDKDLKLALKMGVDMHCFNAVDIFDIKGIPVDELIESHPNYKEHRGRINEDRRHKSKEGVHATNYGVRERTLAATMGTTVHEASKFISRWFAAHPGILNWHRKVESQLATKRYVENKFGFRRYYFDRIDMLLSEALAWIPQSTVAIVINKIWSRIYITVPEVQILLQVHDSLAGQFPTDQLGHLLPRMQDCASVVVPYSDPLIIPVGIKTSSKSWGDCE